MSEKLNKEIIFYRKKSAEILKCTLAKKMPVKQALLAFPRDVDDISVQAAWHALCHLEADEELRNKDKDYAKEQDLFLENVANTLYDGQELPKHITDAYKKYYDRPLTPHKNGIEGFIAMFKNFLNVNKD